MNFFLKRIMDLLISSIALIVLSPIFIIVSIAIKLDSYGPILFKQNRLTRNGEVFEIYKFRSMIVNAEKTGSGLFNFKNDNRITKVGKFLRRTSLDELPQLINVLFGKMSIVGPRPSVKNEIGEYNDLNKKYKKRFQVKGGITGLAQISGRNELPWKIKVEYDNKYVDLFMKFGILIDFKIIILTIFSVFRAKDIYETLDSNYSNLSPEEIARIETENIIYESTRKDIDYNV